MQVGVKDGEINEGTLKRVSLGDRELSKVVMERSPLRKGR